MKKLIVILCILGLCRVCGMAQSAASDSLFVSARTLYERADYKRAAKAFEKLWAMDKDESVGNDELLAIDRHWLAACYLKLGDEAKANAMYPELYVIEPVDRLKISKAIDYANRVNTASSLDMAIHWAERCMEEEIKVLGENSAFVSSSCCTLAMLHLQRNELLLCRSYLDRAKKITKSLDLPGKVWLSPIYAIESLLAQRSGEVDASVAAGERAWECIKINPAFSPAVYGVALVFHLSHISSENEQISELWGSAEVVRNADSDNLLGYLETVRAINGYATRLYQTSLGIELTEHYLEALEQCAAPKDKKREAKRLLYLDLGLLYQQYHKPKKAVELLEASLRMSEDIPGGDQSRAEILVCLFNCYRDARDFDHAESAATEALKAYKKLGKGFEAAAINATHLLAQVKSYKNKPQEAISYMEDCIRMMRRYPQTLPGDVAYAYRVLSDFYGAINDETAKAQSKACAQKAVDEFVDNGLDLSDDVYADCKARVIADLPNDELAQAVDTLIAQTCPDNIAGQQRRIMIRQFEASRILANGDAERALGFIDDAISSAESISGYDCCGLYSDKCAMLSMLKRNDEALALAEKLYQTTRERNGETSQQFATAILLYVGASDKAFSLRHAELYPKFGAELQGIISTLGYDDAAYLVLSNCAAGCFATSDIEHSRQLIETALKNASPELKKTCDFLCLCMKARLCGYELDLGNLARAMELVAEISVQLEGLPKSMDVAVIYDVIGLTYSAGSKFKEAESAFQKCIAMAEELDPKATNLVNLYKHISDLYNMLGLTDEAQKYQDKKLALADNFDNKCFEMSNKLDRLWAHYDLGAKEDCYNDILELEEYLNSLADFVDNSLIDNLKATYFYREGDMEQAAQYVEQALDKNVTLNNLNLACDIYCSSGQTDKELEKIKQLQEYTYKYKGDDALNNIGPTRRLADLYYRLQQYDESLLHYKECLDYSSKYVEQNILTMTEKQRTDFWTTNNYFYTTFLPQMALQGNMPSGINALAYDATLFSKGLLLTADQSIADIVKKSPADIKELYGRYAARKSMLKKLSDEFNSLWLGMVDKYSESAWRSYEAKEAEVQALSDECSAICRELIDKIYDARGDKLVYRSYTWGDVQRNLPAHSAAIEYLDFPIDSVNNVIAALVVRKGDKNPILRRLYTYERDDYSIEDVYTPTALGDSLVTRLHDVLADCTDVYFSPQGLLCTVAVESLPRTDEQPLNLYRVSSTRVIAQKRPKRKDYKSTLFGGLNYTTSVDSLIADAEQYPELTRNFVADNLFRVDRVGDAVIPPLPGTLAEVDTIADMLKARRKVTAQIKSGNDGTESAFKALSGKYGSILHIGTHGFYNSGGIIYNSNFKALSYEDLAMEQSGLLLAGAAHRYFGEEELPDNVDDGILKASEIAKLDLTGVNLVAISACESGLGAVTADGVFGLQRGFKKAGVNSILMSLEKVEDNATCCLMTQFYRNWLDGDSKRVALEKAKQYVRSQPGWSDPHYWAVFILLDALD